MKKIHKLLINGKNKTYQKIKQRNGLIIKVLFKKYNKNTYLMNGKKMSIYLIRKSFRKN